MDTVYLQNGEIYRAQTPMAVLPSAEYEAGHLLMPVLKGVGGEGVCVLEGEDAGMGLHARYLGSV